MHVSKAENKNNYVSEEGRNNTCFGRRMSVTLRVSEETCNNTCFKRRMYQYICQKKDVTMHVSKEGDNNICFKRIHM